MIRIILTHSLLFGSSFLSHSGIPKRGLSKGNQFFIDRILVALGRKSINPAIHLLWKIMYGHLIMVGQISR